ncbi:unnamed protein product, partial [Amoebophrya sp. A120]
GPALQEEQLYSGVFFGSPQPSEGQDDYIGDNDDEEEISPGAEDNFHLRMAEEQLRLQNQLVHRDKTIGELRDIFTVDDIREQIDETLAEQIEHEEREENEETLERLYAAKWRELLDEDKQIKLQELEIQDQARRLGGEDAEHDETSKVETAASSKFLADFAQSEAQKKAQLGNQLAHKDKTVQELLAVCALGEIRESVDPEVAEKIELEMNNGTDEMVAALSGMLWRDLLSEAG